MNYVQTVCELVGTMLDSARHAMAFMNCYEYCSRTAQGEFTGSSRLVDTVHEQFIGAVVTLLLNIPEMTSEETSYITETTF